MLRVDSRLQSNRIRDVGSTVRPSTTIRLVTLGAVLLLLWAVAVGAWLAGCQFDLFALLFLLSGRWKVAPAAGWLIFVFALLVMTAVGTLAWWLRRMWQDRSSGDRVTRVDVYAQNMGFGKAVEKVTRKRASVMAERLVKDYDPETMQPGYPLGRNIVDGELMSSSWEDMALVLAGPRSGKSLCYAIPAVCSAPGACVATSNKGDILDVTRPVREATFPNARIWVFDPERIAEPNRTRGQTSWYWNLIGSVTSIAEAKRIADCWRYASGQHAPSGDDFFPGTAAQQLADYLFAAHLGNKTVSSVFRWASNERDSEPADILARFPEYSEIANRVSSVLSLTPVTRSGVFGALQKMVAFLADPDILAWIEPREEDTRLEFDPVAFATSCDTLYLLSAQGRPSTALTASLTAVVAFSAFRYAQQECVDNNRRLPRPLCCVLDEAANICRWPELADVYSYFGSSGIPIMTIWQNPDQGKAAFGETNFGSLFNNANILVYLGGIKDAQWLGQISNLVGQRDVMRGSVNVDARGNRSVNNSVQRETILDVADLAEWPVGRALVLASQCRAQINRTIPWTDKKEWRELVEKANENRKERQS